MFTIDLKGVPAMVANLKTASKEVIDAAAAALFLEANIEMTEAKHRCPLAKVDGGVLRASGVVDEPRITSKRISVMMGFGGAASDYAIAVHEHLSVHSPYSWQIAELEGDGVTWHTPGTGPKFLESVINESEPHMVDRVAATMKTRLGG